MFIKRRSSQLTQIVVNFFQNVFIQRPDFISKNISCFICSFSFHISDHETCGQTNFLSSEKLEGRQSI